MAAYNENKHKLKDQHNYQNNVNVSLVNKQKKKMVADINTGNLMTLCPIVVRPSINIRNEKGYPVIQLHPIPTHYIKYSKYNFHLYFSLSKKKFQSESAMKHLNINPENCLLILYKLQNKNIYDEGNQVRLFKLN